MKSRNGGGSPLSEGTVRERGRGFFMQNNEVVLCFSG